MDTKSDPFCWIKVNNNNDDSNDADDNIADPKPKGRYGHAVCEYGSSMVVFGGFGEGEKYMNDLWLLDCDNLETGRVCWKYVQPGGSYWPKGRDSHCITACGDKLVLFGGFDGVSTRIVPPGERAKRASLDENESTSHY